MMQVSARTEYGLRCLLLLARQDGMALSIPDICQREKLPKHYAQQIMMKLRRAGVVKSIRGTQGGFALAVAPEDVSIGSVVRVLEGVPFQDTCGRFNRRTNCGHLGDCSIRPIWQVISQRLWDALDQIDLRQLLAREHSVSETLKRELPVLTLPTH